MRRKAAASIALTPDHCCRVRVAYIGSFNNTGDTVCWAFY
jgi:hypothetical protein